MKKKQNQKLWSLLVLSVLMMFFYSCKKEDKDRNNQREKTKDPIELSCDFFEEDRILISDPEAEVDYLIKCYMVVRGDIIIEPGVVIEFEQNAGIYVPAINVNREKSSLKAVGTSSNPIIFRGVKNKKGYWRGIKFGSNNPINELNYVQIKNAGGGDEKSGILVNSSAALKIENSTISNSSEYGLDAASSKVSLTLNNNKFTKNKIPARFNPDLIGAIKSSNDFTGNENDYIIIESGTMKNEPTTLHKINVPYKILNSSVSSLKNGIGVINLLTIEPGVIIEHEPNVKWNVTEHGGLKAVGTINEPIIFTAVNKVINGWVGIYFNSKHPLNEIAHAEFHYSGKTTGSFDKDKGSINLWHENVLNIHNVTFKNINFCAIYYALPNGLSENPLLRISNVVVEDVGGCLKSCYGQGCGG